ncbi:PAPA-1-like conserved region-domain-containing protein [Sordaria sp. MPI-SDFR-AT-0083]|nr:PAPA-1-like conserved region-domain-containing protein [Sordaria sp. MPI-SDFR-AT-0083]
MSSRPRRSAAQRATALITDLIQSDRVTPERTMSSSRSTTGRRPPSSPASSRSDANGHNMLTVKVPSNKLREATSGNSSSGIVASRRNRPGAKKSYVVESSEDEDEDMEEEDDDEEVEEADEIEVSNNAPVLDDDEDDEEEEEEEDDEDEDGDVDMDDTPAPPTITVSKAQATTSPNKAKATAKVPSSSPTTIKTAPKTNYYDDDDDDDELSELESEPEDPDLEDMAAAEDDAEEAEEEEDEDMDAEGDEIEVAEDDAEGEEVELDSDDEGGGTPDISKMTARQRAKVGVASHEYMKLSDEVQAKKVFTAEELSMRRAEMARRRRNLSEKRNEEVKMETINKLLKKQAPKTNRKAALLNGDEIPGGDAEPPKADPTFVRWINNKSGSRIAVPEDMVAGPVGQVFTGGVKRKMVEEVA